MGIRVHKIVGYGTDQFVPPTDFEYRREELASWGSKEFLSWLQSNKNSIMDLYCSTTHNKKTAEFNWKMMLLFLEDWKSDPCRLSPSNTIQYNDEFGLKNHLLIIPIEQQKQCFRHDDLIDWLEEEHIEPRWRWLDKGIYPRQKGKLSIGVLAMCVYFGIEAIVPNLREALYVYWS